MAKMLVAGIPNSDESRIRHICKSWNLPDLPDEIVSVKDILDIPPVLVEHSPDLVVIHHLDDLSRLQNLCHFMHQQSDTANIPLVIYKPAPERYEEYHPFLNTCLFGFLPGCEEEMSFIYQIIGAIRFSRLNRARAKVKSQLHEFKAEQNLLMSIVAHDLKSPLNRVLGLIELMPRVGPLNEEQKKIGAMIDTVIASGQKLIEDILTINAYESHLEPIQPVEITLSTFMSEIFSTFEQNAQAKEIKMALSVDAGAMLLTDPDSLQRIIDNLLSNALKFSESGTEINVEVKKLPGKTKFIVKDQGPGISKQDQKKMFKKFQTLSAKPTAGENSTGLGLSIIKALVEKLQGEIKLKSRLGEGSAFTVVIPDWDATTVQPNRA